MANKKKKTTKTTKTKATSTPKLTSSKKGNKVAGVKLKYLYSIGYPKKWVMKTCAENKIKITKGKDPVSEEIFEVVQEKDAYFLQDKAQKFSEKKHITMQQLAEKSKKSKVMVQRVVDALDLELTPCKLDSNIGGTRVAATIKIKEEAAVLKKLKEKTPLKVTTDLIPVED